MYAFLKNPQYGWFSKLGQLVDYWLYSSHRRVFDQLLIPPTGSKQALATAALALGPRYVSWVYRGEVVIEAKHLTTHDYVESLAQKRFVGSFLAYVEQGLYTATWLGILYVAARLSQQRLPEDGAREADVEVEIKSDNRLTVYGIDAYHRLLSFFTAEELSVLEMAMTGEVAYARSFGLPVADERTLAQAAHYCELVTGENIYYAKKPVRRRLLGLVLANIAHNNGFDPLYKPKGERYV